MSLNGKVESCPPHSPWSALKKVIKKNSPEERLKAAVRLPECYHSFLDLPKKSATCIPPTEPAVS